MSVALKNHVAFLQTVQGDRGLETRKEVLGPVQPVGAFIQ
jgi:hypothetical protein